ncbi:putative gustatory receptor 39b [Bactrocera dorsalis]|uniref:Gustatory receptor n=1 Tax=Bactrocera dorsalis TaxID=27457 RepID=A0ABM3JNL6_BACDO|nr:putative gustatory receptor 39b [Bactrocera dorsalis]
MEQQLQAWFRYASILGIQTGNAHTPRNQHVTGLCRAHTKRRSAFSQKINVLISRLQRCYYYALLLWVFAVYINGLYWRRRIPNAMLTWLVATTLFTAQAITNVLIIAESLWKQQEHEAFLLLLQRIAFAFKLRLRQPIEQQQFLLSLRRLLCFSMAVWLVGLLLFLLTSLWLQYIGYFWYGLWFIITMRVRIIQLLIYLRLLQHYMRCLCKQLSQVVAYHSAPDSRMLDYNYARLLTLEYLLAVKEVYALLCEAFHLLNDFAGWSLYSIISCFMLDITCNIYWSELILDGSASRRYYYIASIWWIISMIAIVWHICRLSDNCKQLDRLIANLLSRIIVSNTARSLRTYRLCLQQFTMQLQLQPLEVSARGFFILDMPLLMSAPRLILIYTP